LTTLLSVYNGKRCIGRCDAKCHNAIGPRCVCICGGRNHGIGAAKAQEAKWEITEQDIQEWLKGVDPEDNGHRVVRQPVLFALPQSPKDPRREEESTR